MKRILWIMLLAAVLITAALPAYAASLYPANVDYLDGGDIPIIKKTYQLDPGDDPADIPTADFERRGFLYSLTDMLKSRTMQADHKEYTQIVTYACENDKMEDVLKLFAPTHDVITEDGYGGTLALDHTTITVSVDGYSNRSYTATATRTYPNLSAADISLVPKEIQDKGRTLKLDGVTWQEASSGNVDDYYLPERYTALATYAAKVGSRVATGYTASAEYAGEVVKNLSGAATYTAIFEGMAITPPEAEPAPEPPAAYHPSAYFFALAMLLIFGVMGYGAVKVRRHLQQRREG